MAGENRIVGFLSKVGQVDIFCAIVFFEGILWTIIFTKVRPRLQRGLQKALPILLLELGRPQPAANAGPESRLASNSGNDVDRGQSDER